MNSWLPPVRLDLYPSESLAGFFIRLCDVNGWWSQRDLADKLGVTGVALRYQLGDLDLLERSLGLPAGSLPLPASRHGREHSVVGGHTFSGRHFHRSRRICPHCIEETGYQRAYWELKFVTRCHLHSVALVTSCACGTPLNWTDHALATCNGCVTSDPLPQATTTVSHKPFQSWALRAIGVTDQGDGGSEIDGTGVAEAIAVTQALGLLSRSGFARTRPGSEVAEDLLREEGFEIVMVGSLDKLVSKVVGQYMEQHGQRCPLAPADALGWFGDLVLAYSRNGLSPLMDRVTASLGRALGYRVTDPGKSDYVSLTHVGRLTGVSSEVLLQALDQIDTGGGQLRLGDGEIIIPIGVVVALRQAVGEWK